MIKIDQDPIMIDDDLIMLTLEIMIDDYQIMTIKDHNRQNQVVN